MSLFNEIRNNVKRSRNQIIIVNCSSKFNCPFKFHLCNNYIYDFTVISVIYMYIRYLHCVDKQFTIIIYLTIFETYF